MMTERQYLSMAMETLQSSKMDGDGKIVSACGTMSDDWLHVARATKDHESPNRDIDT